MIDLLATIDPGDVLEGVVGGLVASLIVLFFDRFVFERRASVRGLRRSVGPLLDRLRGGETSRCTGCGRRSLEYVDDQIYTTKRDDVGTPLERYHEVVYRCTDCDYEETRRSDPYETAWADEE